MASEISSPSALQKRIKEHLARSSGGDIDFQRSPQNYNPETKKSQTTPVSKSRQEHIERSKGNYNLNSGSKQERKSRILNHVRITKG
ncbi:MAG: hypothetical protein AAFQ80_10835 [Cyanobacteria bacterium J06621_8]